MYIIKYVSLFYTKVHNSGLHSLFVLPTFIFKARFAKLIIVVLSTEVMNVKNCTPICRCDGILSINIFVY